MLEWLWMAKSFLQNGLNAAVFLLALWRGGAPERILSGLLLAMPVCDFAYHLAAGGAFLYHKADIGHLAIDSAVFAIAAVVAIHANRVYPLWIGGAQIIALLAHAYRLSLSQINTFAYQMMSVMPSYIQLAAMMLGLAFHMSRQKRLGSYPSWRSSFGPLPAPPQTAPPGL